MMVRITFLDGSKVDLDRDPCLVGINNASDVKNGFYLQQVYNSGWDKQSLTSTSDERLGICGFILSHDAFALDESIGAPIYFKTSVKCVEFI